jgi:hypothetical protein
MQKDYKMFPPTVDWDNIDWSTRRPQMDFPVQVYTVVNLPCSVTIGLDWLHRMTHAMPYSWWVNFPFLVFFGASPQPHRNMKIHHVIDQVFTLAHIFTCNMIFLQFFFTVYVNKNT